MRRPCLDLSTLRGERPRFDCVVIDEFHPAAAESHELTAMQLIW